MKCFIQVLNIKIVNLLEYFKIFDYVATIIRSHKIIFKVYYYYFFQEIRDLMVSYRMPTGPRVASKVNLKRMKTKNLSFITFHCLCCLVTLNFLTGSFFCACSEGSFGRA